MGIWCLSIRDERDLVLMIFLEEIGFDGYVCGCGTAIYVGEKTIFKNTLTKEYCREIIKMLRTCNITAVFEEENRVSLMKSFQIIKFFMI